GREVDLDEIAPRARRQVLFTPGIVGHTLQGLGIQNTGAALRRGARQPDLDRILRRFAPQLAGPRALALRPEGGSEADPRDRSVVAIDARVGADALEMPRRFARIAAREQRLGEIEPGISAAALAAGLAQLVEIVELRRGGGARKRLVQVGAPQVDHAEHQLRLRPALAVETGVFQQPPRLLVAALLVELHRRRDRVVRTTRRSTAKCKR